MKFIVSSISGFVLGRLVMSPWPPVTEHWDMTVQIWQLACGVIIGNLAAWLVIPPMRKFGQAFLKRAALLLGLSVLANFAFWGADLTWWYTSSLYERRHSGDFTWSIFCLAMFVLLAISGLIFSLLGPSRIKDSNQSKSFWL